MAEYLEKSAVIKAIHNEIYSGGKWSGGWYEIPEEKAEKNFTKRINAITPEKVIDISVIEKITTEIEERATYEGIYLDRADVLDIIDKAVKEIRNDR